MVSNILEMISNISEMVVLRISYDIYRSDICEKKSPEAIPFDL